MRDFAKQENGQLGQKLSDVILSKDFWTILRPVDADAADLMVQRKYETQEDIQADRATPLQFATVQAKYFEGKNQVKIARHYLFNEDGTSPRRAFLAFLHTHDDEEEAVHYLFDASEIIDKWEERTDYYFFSLADGRTYADFRKLSPKRVREKVNDAIAQSTAQSMAWGWKTAADLYSTVRAPHCLEPQYRLLKVHGACIAIFEGGYGQLGHPLEMRKDVVPSPGTFEWGYPGTGPKLLAASLLTHFFCGRRPNENEITRTLDYLISRLERDKEAQFGKEEILKALAQIPYDLNLEDIGSWAESYHKTEREYSSYFIELPGSTGPLEGEQPVSEIQEDEAPEAPR
ncbi:DUF6166 domain-containing protein [Massilia jejuensis]|uniref:DUF6166 domain-containing protein n=1 Tax=Massilia jejuensis TaxID=648894 RepID=A0ABW0PEB9_9BURK